MSDEMDPEVLADIQLRAATMRERSRSRISGAAIGQWRPEADVAWWPCRGLNRANPCPQRTLVGVTSDVVEQLFAFNERLRRMGDDALDSSEVVRCLPCIRGIAAQRAPALRKRVGEVAECVRQLKASPDPRRERELIKQLEAWHHPDVPGLLQAIEERTRANGGKRVTRGSL